MDIFIQLITESFLGESLAIILSSIGYQIEIFDIYVDELTIIESQFADVTIIQAHLWNEIKSSIPSSSMLCMVGFPSQFCYWLEMTKACDQKKAFITSEDSPNTIKKVIEKLNCKNHFISATMQRFLTKAPKKRQQILLGKTISDHLTPSELEILVLIGKGYTSSEIAGIRDRSIHTIKTQRKAIRKKLQMMHGQRLGVFSGRQICTLKTLSLIEKEDELLKDICKNTH